MGPGLRVEVGTWGIRLSASYKGIRKCIWDNTGIMENGNHYILIGFIKVQGSEGVAIVVRL